MILYAIVETGVMNHEHDETKQHSFFMDTILFVIGMSFLSINTVIPYFLNTLGASTLEISMASILVSIGTFISQPYFARKIVGLTYKLKAFIKILSIQRIFFFIFVLTIPLTVRIHYRLTIILFLICWGIFNFFVGSYSPFFMSLFSKMVPDDQKGRLLGFSNAVGNLIALGAAGLISILLNRLPFPYNFACIFGLGVFCLLLDCLDFCFMKESPDESTGQPMGTWEYFRNIPRILRFHPRYASLVAGYSLLTVSNVSLVYYSLFAIRHYNAQASEIALFTGIGVTINVIGNILYGILADRYSHRLVLQISSFCGALAAVIVAAVPSLLSVFAAFTLSNLCSAGYILSTNILIMHNSPRESLPVFVSTNVMVTLMISSIFTMISSFLVDHFSFILVFIITGGAALGAFLILSLIYKRVPLSLSDNGERTFARNEPKNPRRKISGTLIE